MRKPDVSDVMILMIVVPAWALYCIGLWWILAAVAAAAVRYAIGS